MRVKQSSKCIQPDHWIGSMLLAGVLMLLSFVFCRLVFETNDDNGIIAITSGAFTGSPYAGNGYTTYLYGALLASLYTTISSVPWHTVLMQIAIFFSLAAMIRSVACICEQNKVSKWLGSSVFVALYMGVLLQYVVTLQYTTVAAFAAASGMGLLLVAQQKGSTCKQKGTVVVAIFLFAFSFCLRTESFWVSMLMLVIFTVLQSMELRLGRPLALVLGILLGAGALTLVDQTLYRANEANWDAFRVFYELRCQLLDYHNTDFMQQVATQVLHWPSALVSILRNWYLLDEHTTVTQLKTLLDTVQAAMPDATISSLLKSTASILRRYPMFAFNFMAFGAWSLYAGIRYGKHKQWFALLRLVTPFLFVVVFIAYFYGLLGRLPQRAAFAVACPAYLYLMIASIPAWCTFEEHEGICARRLYPRVAIFGVCLLLLAGVGTLAEAGEQQLPLRWQQAGQDKREVISQTIRDYANAHPALVYVTDIPQRYGPCYTGEMAAVNLFEWGHAMQGSDSIQAKLNANGLNTLTTDALFDNRFCLILSDSKVTLFLDYLDTLYPHVSLTAVDAGQGYSVYQLQKTNTDPE